MDNNPETIADICREMRSKIDCLADDPGYNHFTCHYASDWAKRIEAALAKAAGEEDAQ